MLHQLGWGEGRWVTYVMIKVMDVIVLLSYLGHYHYMNSLENEAPFTLVFATTNKKTNSAIITTLEVFASLKL